MSAPRGLVVAATKSASGKTSVAVGLMAALARLGLRVQPFKVGPDFIDPGHHTLAAGRPSHNLDGYMCSKKTVFSIFSRHAQDADAVVVEGVMGLFDGASGRDEAGGTAEMAKWLGLPVLLVVDARSMGRSAAALVSGFARFDPDLPLAGVVFNMVGSAAHREILAEAMTAVPDVPVFGYLDRDADLAMPSRHLGLVMAGEREDGAEVVRRLADRVEAGIDLAGLLGVMPELDLPPTGPEPPAPRVARIGLARDRAFCFYYEENLRLLRSFGAEIAPFSPLSEARLPEGLDGLYLGGGYPELFVETLSANGSMTRSIREFCQSGRPVYAECGGFMYLMEFFEDSGGRRHPLAGVFPMGAVLSDRLASLGYRQVTTRASTILGPAGTVLRGHEFHYSRARPLLGPIQTAYALSGRTGPLDRPEGYMFKRVLGSYVHLHFGGNPDAARFFVAACAARHAPSRPSGPGGPVGPVP